MFCSYKCTHFLSSSSSSIAARGLIYILSFITSPSLVSLWLLPVPSLLGFVVKMERSEKRRGSSLTRSDTELKKRYTDVITLSAE